MNVNPKFQQWMIKEFPHHCHNSIFEDGQGSVMAFARYVIRMGQEGSYMVSTLSDQITTFSSQRAAMAYCVADKYKDFNLARRILQLDKQKTLMRHDLSVRRNISARSGNARFAETVLTKVDRKASLCRDISSELDKCIDKAKYLQLQGFTNETARTRRS